jgi:hypothetical protein
LELFFFEWIPFPFFLGLSIKEDEVEFVDLIDAIIINLVNNKYGKIYKLAVCLIKIKHYLYNMILDFLICKAYKVNKEFITKFWGQNAEKGRIIFCAMYIGSNGFEKFKVWILATTIKPALATFKDEFIRASEAGCLEEIDIDNELYWLNNHLNKEVSFC